MYMLQGSTMYNIIKFSIYKFKMLAAPNLLSKITAEEKPWPPLPMDFEVSISHVERNYITSPNFLVKPRPEIKFT